MTTLEHNDICATLRAPDSAITELRADVGAEGHNVVTLTYEVAIDDAEMRAELARLLAPPLELDVMVRRTDAFGAVLARDPVVTHQGLRYTFTVEFDLETTLTPDNWRDAALRWRSME